MIKIGNRYKVKYGNWISDRAYEVISKEAEYYIIGINNRDKKEISGWAWANKEYECKSGMKYNRFLYVYESELIECYNNYMEIE